jgi:hypothetical protein
MEVPYRRWALLRRIVLFQYLARLGHRLSIVGGDLSLCFVLLKAESD